MSKPFDKTNTITLNVNVSDNEKAPKLRGLINIEGKEFKCSLWVREGKDSKFWSGTVEPKETPKEDKGDLPFNL